MVHPVFAETLGWDVDAASNHDVVTLIRRKVVLEEVVISKEQFEQMNECIKDSEDHSWNELEWKDAQWTEYTLDHTEYTAFPGDVTSFSDDCVNFFENSWFDYCEPMKLNSPGLI